MDLPDALMDFYQVLMPEQVQLKRLPDEFWVDSSSSSTNSKENYADLCESVKELKQLLADFIRAQQPATPPATPPTGSEVQHANFPADNTAPQSRFTKLDFPQYAGKEDPLIWLHRCELYFHTTHTPDREKVGLAAFNMTGEAQLWYYQILRDEPPLSWLLFKEYCKLRFGPPRSNNPLGELANLKQRGRHIDEYVEDFQTLLARATSVRFEQQVDLFTAGLDELLRIDVERSKPASLAEAVNTARDFARKFQLLGLAVARQSPRPVSSLPSSPVISHKAPSTT
nr:Retrotransposon gag protein [Ipomoea batatas]